MRHQKCKGIVNNKNHPTERALKLENFESDNSDNKENDETFSDAIV